MVLSPTQSSFGMSIKFRNVTQCCLKYHFLSILFFFYEFPHQLQSIFFSHICSFSPLFPLFFPRFFSFFSIWVWRRCGWLRGFVDFITRIFTGMKLNANTEQIEGKLYFNIRGNFSLKFGWGRSLIKHVYTIIILLFKAFSSFSLSFSSLSKETWCLHHYYPSFQSLFIFSLSFFFKRSICHMQYTFLHIVWLKWSKNSAFTSF